MRVPTLLAAFLVAGCSDALTSQDGSLLKEMPRGSRVTRWSPAMLSVPVNYARCVDGSASNCATTKLRFDEAWTSWAGSVARKAVNSTEPDVLHAAALVDLLAGDRGKSLDRSISYLEMATRIAPTPNRLVDLSAGYLIAAERDDDARSEIAALDAAARAKAAEPTNAAAAFNLALALRNFGLFGAARSEFLRFVDLKASPEWIAEAREYAASLVVDTVRVARDSVFTIESMRALARLHPNEARTSAWAQLGLWGEALERADIAAASEHLLLAEAAGATIASDHVDASIADAVASIRKARSPRGLALAHKRLLSAQDAAQRGKPPEAERLYKEVARLGKESHALVAWADYGAASARVNMGDARGAEPKLREMAASRYPSVSARANWALGVILLRRGQLDDGRRAAVIARDLYERMGEPELRGAMVSLIGEAENLRGDSRAAYARFREALNLMRDYPLSTWRHNNLLLLSRAAAADGFTAAAELIAVEDDAASLAAGRLTSLVESRLTHTQQLLARGDTTAARAELARGKQLAAGLPAENTRRQLETEIGLAEAEVDLSTAIDRRPALDLSVTFFKRINNQSKLLRSYSARARWLAATGKPTEAEWDLDSALTIFEKQRAAVGEPGERALLQEQARRVGDALAGLRIARGDATGAVVARERARSGGSGDILPPTVGPVVEIMLSDAKVNFLITRGSSSAMFRGDVNRAKMRTDIEQLDAGLGRGLDTAALLPPLERLYATLISPIAAEIAGDSIVTFIVDEALGRVPFAALRDERDGKYLIDRHALRFASSLHQAAGHESIPRNPRVLLASAADVDRRVFPQLQALPGAGREVDTIANVVERRRVLHGAETDSASLERGLKWATVFHFSGHALFDDARPERSQLVLGSHGLTAKAISQLRLPALRLVVLSACETNRTATSPGAAGFLGLADSFIAAGANGVIGSSWKVDDAATLELMQAFYEALMKSGDPVMALRHAQRSMRTKSPAAWAAFRYAGR